MNATTAIAPAFSFFYWTNRKFVEDLSSLEEVQIFTDLLKEDATVGRAYYVDNATKEQHLVIEQVAQAVKSNVKTFGRFVGIDAQTESRLHTRNLSEREYNYFKRRLENDARLKGFGLEVVHDAMEYFARPGSELDAASVGERGLTYYMLVKMRNLIKDEIRTDKSQRRMRQNFVPFSAFDGRDDSADLQDSAAFGLGVNTGPNQLDAAYILNRVQEVIGDNPVWMRVFACLVEGMKPQDIAAQLGMDEEKGTGEIRQHMFRLKKKLAKNLPELAGLLGKSVGPWAEGDKINRETRYVSSKECLQRAKELELA
jgi:DNA-directed RNA polymerase specialized sigma24 family protein